MTTAPPLLASWPQPQSFGVCVFTPVMAVWPPVPFVLAARSLLSPEPVPRLTLAATVAGTAVMAYFLLPVGPRGKPVPAEWWYAALAAALLAPAVVFREGRKRGWFRFAHRPASAKQSRPPD